MNLTPQTNPNFRHVSDVSGVSLYQCDGVVLDYERDIYSTVSGDPIQFSQINLQFTGGDTKTEHNTEDTIFLRLPDGEALRIKLKDAPRMWRKESQRDVWGQRREDGPRLHPVGGKQGIVSAGEFFAGFVIYGVLDPWRLAKDPDQLDRGCFDPLADRALYRRPARLFYRTSDGHPICGGRSSAADLACPREISEAGKCG